MDINMVMISGNLVRDPEIKYTQDERKLAIARFTLGCNSNPKAEKDGKNYADYPQFVAFDKTAEWMDKKKRQGKLVKGAEVLVTGKVKTSSYEKNGTRFYTTDIAVETIKFLGESAAASPQAAEAPERPTAEQAKHTPVSDPQKREPAGDGFVPIPESDPDEEDWF